MALRFFVVFGGPLFVEAFVCCDVFLWFLVI